MSRQNKKRLVVAQVLVLLAAVVGGASLFLGSRLERTASPLDTSRALRTAGIATIPMSAADMPEGPAPANKNPAVDTSRALRGWVRSRDGRAVEHATVRAELETKIDASAEQTAPASTNSLASAMSAADGSFALRDIEPGKYRLRIEGAGVMPSELRFVTVPGDGAILVVGRTQSVSGRVVGMGLKSVPVRVVLSGIEGAIRREKALEADGTFAFPSVPEGRFTIWAEGPALASPAQELSCTGGSKCSPLTLKLQTAFDLDGRVVESGSSQLGVAAYLVARRVDGSEMPRNGLSSISGEFSFASLLPGRWLVRARAPGYLESDVLLVDVESSHDLLLRVGKGGEVRGRVLREDRGAAVGAQVELVGHGTGGEPHRYRAAIQQVASPPAGGSTLLERGELGVLLGPIPLVPLAGTLTAKCFSRDPIRGASDGSAVAGICAAKAATTGRTSGQRLDDVLPIAPDRTSIFRTMANGRFHITGIAPGRYRLHVYHRDFATVVSEEFKVRGKGKAVERTQILRRGIIVSGDVAGEGGAVIAGASLYAHFADGRAPALAVSDADGVFRFAAMTGTIDLVAEAVGFGVSHKKLSLGLGGLSARATHVAMRLARANAVVRGQLVDSTGFAVRDAEIGVVESRKQLPVATAHSDAEGLFRIEGLVGGAHKLRIKHRDFPEYVATIHTGTSAEITVPLGAAVVFSLLDRQSENPLFQPVVTLVPVAGGKKVEVTADVGGVARFAALSPGTYKLRASAQGYAVALQEIRLEALSARDARPREIRLLLSRGSVLAGVLVDSDGERVGGAILSIGASVCETDAVGRFRLVDVDSGPQQLKIRKGKSVARVGLRIEEGEERVTMELRFLPDEPAPVPVESR